MKTQFLAIMALVGTAGAANAGQLTSRADLNTLLATEGITSVTDDFETYAQSAGAFTDIGTLLDSTSVINGQGPGLVHPGAFYTAPGGPDLAFAASGYQSATSQELFVNPTSGGQRIIINFPHNARAMGLDVSTFFSGGAAVQFFIFRGDGLMIDNPGVLATTQPQFFGYEYVGGISEVVILNESSGQYAPVIDNHTYGEMPVPEPTSVFAVGVGILALARRRSRKNPRP